MQASEKLQISGDKLEERELNLREEPELLLRVYRDLLDRSKPGLLTYPIVWLLIVFSSDLHNSHPQMAWFFGVVFVVTSVIRFWHISQISQGLKSYATWWRRGLYLLIIPHSFGWGFMFGYSLLIDNTQFSLLMAFSTAGLIAGGTNSFAPQKNIAYFFLITFTCPAMLITLLLTQQWAVAFMLIIYTLYLIKQANQQNNEYWRSLMNEQTLSKQSRTDALTQLDNRRFFDEKLDELCHLSSRNYAMIAVLVIDCDHFKNINDTYGHDFGDQCLQHLAAIFRQALPRETETCARYGGEEFCIILPGTDTNGALIVAEKIRSKVASSPIYNGKKKITMTVSIGVVARQMEKFEPNLPTELFKHADKALYQAKQSGRDRCVVAKEWQPEESEVISAST